MRGARLRALSLLAVLVALVASMASGAIHASSAAGAARARQAIAVADREVMELLADPKWPLLQSGYPRHPFVEASDYDAALRAAQRERAWRASLTGPPGRSIADLAIVDYDGDRWLAQRSGSWSRARLWEPVAESIRARTGVVVDLEGQRGLPFMPRRLSVDGRVVTAIVPSTAAPLAPWLGVGRGLLAMFAAGLLVREVLGAQREREREQAREAVLQRISHELRTPAASVRSLGEALAAGAVEDPDEQRRFVALIRSEAERLALGIDRLLRAARGEPTAPIDPIPFDLAAWARVAADRWRSRLPELVVEAPESLAWRADPDRLDEALDALLDNADKHGGPSVVLTVARAGRNVTLSVRDDGPGVPAAARSRIFGRLQRIEGRPEDAGGYGLGLWAAAEVARAHGGSLSLQGKACFVITLPDAP